MAATDSNQSQDVRMQSRLRIVLLTQFFPPDFGGMATRAAYIARGLAERGHNVTVVTTQPHYPTTRKGASTSADSEPPLDGVDVVRIPPLALAYDGFLHRITQFLWFSFLGFFYALRTCETDIIISAYPHPLIDFSGFLLKLAKRGSLIADVSDLWPDAIHFESPLGRLLGRLGRSLNFLLSNILIDGLVVYNDRALEFFQQEYGYERRGDVFYNAVDMTLYGPGDSVERPHLRSKIHADFSGRMVVSYHGVIGPYQGIENIVRAAGILQVQDPSVVFVISGEGERLEQVLQQIENENIHNVLFLGSLPRLEIARIISEVDLGLVPISYPNRLATVVAMPTKWAEYLASGVPVVVPRNSFVAELTSEHLAGLETDFSNPESIAESISEFMRLGTARPDFRRNARSLAGELLDYRLCAERLEGVLTSVVQPRQTQTTPPVEKAEHGLVVGPARALPRMLLVYWVCASALLAAVIFLLLLSEGTLTSTLLIGWDTPTYAWFSQDVLRHGPWTMITYWGYPEIYLLVNAAVGAITGSALAGEAFLPLSLLVLLSIAMSLSVYHITGNVHLAGFTAILSVILENTLRLYSDLHRNLFALTLAMYFIYSITATRLANKNAFVLTGWGALFGVLIAGSQFETYAILVPALLVASLLRVPRTRFVHPTVGLALGGTPIAVALVVNGYLSGFQARSLAGGAPLTLFDIGQWVGAFPLFLPATLVGTAVLFMFVLRRTSHLLEVLFAWVLVCWTLFAAVNLQLVPISYQFAFRVLLLMPTPVLVSLVIWGVLCFRRHRVESSGPSISSRHRHSVVRVVVATSIALVLAGNAVIMIPNTGRFFLTSYVDESVIQKLMLAQKAISSSDEQPILVFYGDPAVWYSGVIRGYAGSILGDHFAYYGQLEDLVDLRIGSPLFSDSARRRSEEVLAHVYYQEMTGSYRVLYYHYDFIHDTAAVLDHPLVVIAPELYNYTIPIGLNAFSLGFGVYVVTARNMSGLLQAIPGPNITVTKNGAPTSIQSSYVSISPQDATQAVASISLGTGASTYNIPEFPSNWTYWRAFEGDDPTHYEDAPVRFNLTPANDTNDPAEETGRWSVVTGSSISEDTVTKKEGSGSIRATGPTDQWQNLGMVFNNPTPENWSRHDALSFWGRCQWPASIGVVLINPGGALRNYFDLHAISGCDNQWQRFVIYFQKYFGQQGPFTLSNVSRVSFYSYYPNAGNNTTLWIDDPVIDNMTNEPGSFLISRVNPTEPVVVYFHVVFQPITGSLASYAPPDSYVKPASLAAVFSIPLAVWFVFNRNKSTSGEPGENAAKRHRRMRRSKS